MKWHHPLGEENTLRVLGTISNDLGCTTVALIYNTDADRASARQVGFPSGHDYFLIVPRDLADGVSEISVKKVLQDPLGFVRVFHRMDDSGLDVIKRTIELEAKLLGFVPAD